MTILTWVLVLNCLKLDRIGSRVGPLYSTANYASQHACLKEAKELVKDSGCFSFCVQGYAKKSKK